MRYLLLLALCSAVIADTDDEDAAKWISSIFQDNSKANSTTIDDDDSLDLTPGPRKDNKISNDYNINFDPTKTDDDSLDLTPGSRKDNKISTENKVDLTPTKPNTRISCRTDANEVGFCVLYYLCNQNSKTIITDGTDILDTRALICPHYLEVCCAFNYLLSEAEILDNNDGDDEETEPSTSIVTAKGSTTTPSTLIAHDLDVQPSASMNRGCGWNNPGIRIFNKTVEGYGKISYANYGEFPFMVAVIQKVVNTTAWSQNDYQGGGSLIHPSVVMTAAHTVKNLVDLKCRAGEWDTRSVNEQFPYQERDVQKTVVHPGYYRTSLYNDVALLFLKSPFDLATAPHIGIACLEKTLPGPPTDCYSMGWGAHGFDSTEYAHIIKKVRLGLVGADDCQNKLQKTRLGPFFRLHSSLTCAGGEEGVDTCKGDGGAPLVCPIQEDRGATRYSVVGMVSYGIECKRQEVPGVYANVPQAYDWVQQTMTSEGYTDLQFVY